MTVTASTRATGVAVGLHNVTVRFGDFVALNDVDVRLAGGKIHVLAGQNGAGKTTLARVLLGMVAPSAGTVTVDDVPIRAADVSAARAAGIGMVHQEFTLPPTFRVAEALEVLTSTGRQLRPVRKRTLNAKWHDFLSSMDISVDLDARVGSLPVETLQSLEIVRALAAQSRFLILDEPTAVLSPVSVQTLFTRLRRLRDRGVTIVVVLHKVPEILQIADEVTVLRDGNAVARAVPVAELDPKTLAELIVGDRAEQAGSVAEIAAGDVVVDAEAAVELRDVSTSERAGEDATLDGVTLRVGRGEIVGVAGVEGNGQRSMVETVVGFRRAAAGKIRLAGSDVSSCDVQGRRRHGLRVIPFDRRTEGVSTSAPLWENVAAGWLVLGRRPVSWISRAGLRRDATGAARRWGVRFSDIRQSAGSLSGGNIQRLIFAREVRSKPTLLVAAQPTRGLDIAGIGFVHSTLRELRASGSGVLLVSSDFDEVLTLSDRIVVMLRGRVVGEYTRPFDAQRIAAAMVGQL